MTFMVSMSICLCVRLSVGYIGVFGEPAKTAEPIDVSLRKWTRVGPIKNHVLDRVWIPSMFRGIFFGGGMCHMRPGAIITVAD